MSILERNSFPGQLPCPILRIIFYVNIQCLICITIFSIYYYYYYVKIRSNVARASDNIKTLFPDLKQSGFKISILFFLHIESWDWLHVKVHRTKMATRSHFSTVTILASFLGRIWTPWRSSRCWKPTFIKYCKQVLSVLVILAFWSC